MTNQAHFAREARKLGVYTGTQVANMVGRSPETIARWRKKGMIGGTKSLIGDVEVFTYTKAELDTIKRIARTLKRGRKKQAAPPITKIIRKKRKRVVMSGTSTDV